LNTVNLKKDSGNIKLNQKQKIMKMQHNQSRREWLISLRKEEMEALEMLDLARNTGDPILQAKALDKLRRTMIDFAFDTFLISYGKGEYKIDYSYYSEWQKTGTMKSIHSEIERLDNPGTTVIPGLFYNQ
jgi:hypothetical protein